MSGHVISGDWLSHMRPGAEYFDSPAEPLQRRYEALRCYFVEGSQRRRGRALVSATPPATVQQLAYELRAGRTEFFRSSKPGPKGPRKSVTVRDRVLALRAQDRSVTEIAERLSGEGTPVSAQTVWGILHAEGIDASVARHAGRGAAPGTGQSQGARRVAGGRP